MAKNASGAAFISCKKRAEERREAAKQALMLHSQSHQEEGGSSSLHLSEQGGKGGSSNLKHFKEDLFEVQHHHLLTCLERITVSEKCLFRAVQDLIINDYK